MIMNNEFSIDDFLNSLESELDFPGTLDTGKISRLMTAFEEEEVKQALADDPALMARADKLKQRAEQALEEEEE
jgi:hypothetical protein